MVAVAYSKISEGKKSFFKCKLLKFWSFHDKIASGHRKKAEMRIRSVITYLFFNAFMLTASTSSE